MDEKILIIEDDAMLQELLYNKLKNGGFNVYKADSAEKGVLVLEKTKIDLILLDLLLPGISGEQFLNEIKKNKLYKKIPVIVLTVKGDDANIHNCLESLGADEYVMKNKADLNEILLLVKNILHINSTDHK